MQESFYRLIIFIGMFSYTIWGYVVSEWYPQVKVDSLIHRFLACSPIILLNFLGMFFRFIRERLYALMYTAIIVVHIDYIYLIIKNDFDTFYSIGLFVIASCCLSAIGNRIFLYLYSSSLMVICLIFILFLDRNSNFKIYWGNLFTLIAISAYFAHIRISLKESLDRKGDVISRFSNLAAQAAHDIRSPLLALNTVMSERYNILESKKIIKDSVDRINYIAGSLVDIYRAEQTNLKISSSKQRLNPIIQNLIREKQVQYSNIVIHLQGAADDIFMCEEVINNTIRILANVIQNSVEAIVDNGRIDVSFNSCDGLVIFTIIDNGIGIPDEYVSEVFQRGVSLNKKEGTGLGLAHAREYLESIGGKIELTSKVGKGTLVILQVPIS